MEVKKFDPHAWRDNDGATDFGLFETGLKTRLRKRYGSKPFDLTTLQAAKRALSKLPRKELASHTYHNSLGEMCCLGAFACNSGGGELSGSNEVREYLVEAKNYDPRTVDALEAVNQFQCPGESDNGRYKRVVAWINEQMGISKERAKKRA